MTTVTYRPNGAGSNTECLQDPSSGSNYDKVDEVSADDASTYVYTYSTSYKVDTYNFANPTETGVIDNITVYVRVSTVITGTSYAKAAILIGPTLYYGDEETIGASWATKSKTWTTNPATSARWEWADLNSAEIGVALKYSSGSGPAGCTQVYLEIEYHKSGSYAVALGV